MPHEKQAEEEVRQRRPSGHTPRGILYLLQPEYADLVEPEYKFEQKMQRALKQGRLYLSNPNTVH